MEIKEIHNKILDECELSLEEVHFYLEYLKNAVINAAGLNEYNLTKCKEVCHIICFFYTSYFDGESFYSVPLNLNEIGINYITHYTSFIKFKTNNGHRCYILDPTMPQFSTDKYMIDNGEIIDIKNNINEDQAKIIDCFKSKGYIEATPYNLVQFINIFINSLIANNIAVDKSCIHTGFKCFCEKYRLISENNSLDFKKIPSIK